MPDKKIPKLDGDVIAKAIEKELPGWHLAKAPRVDDALLAEASTQAQPGVTLRSLRRKFLGEEADASDSEPEADSGSDETEDYGQVDSERLTIQVEPEDGGVAKVADLLRGKVKIVQG